MTTIPRTFVLLLGAMILCTLSLSAQHKVRIIQTNSAGDNVTIIDPATNKVVGEIKGIEAGHGAGASPDGTRIYVSNEAESTLDFVDAKTLKVLTRVPLTAHPNNMAVGKDGKYVFVGIIQDPGGVDVIETATQKMIKNVPTKGTIHNVYVTPDGKYAVAGSIGGKSINVIDAHTLQTAWTMDMDLGVRPMTFNTNPDGSTKWIFLQVRASMDLPSSISRPARRSTGSRTRTFRRASRSSRPDPIRRTAWPSRPTARRSWSAAASTTTSTRIRCLT